MHCGQHAPDTSEIFAGLMSGTSMDGVDGVLLAFDAPGRIRRTLATASVPMPEALRRQLTVLQQPGPNELARGALAANQLADLYADCLQALLRSSGLPPSQVRAIGAHGQTVRHAPDSGYSLQLLNAARLAALTGIDVIHDLRSADLAVGGQGAPLMPAFHALLFGNLPGRYGILNLGGIANLSILDNTGTNMHVMGFDTGPANTLLDQWSECHRGTRFDDRGQWAASGSVLPDLLAQLLQEPYFSAPPPKSTGRDLFNLGWLEQRLQQAGHPAVSSTAAKHACLDDTNHTIDQKQSRPHRNITPQDVQATLAALTAESAASAIRSAGLAAVHVCGGGAENQHLMAELQRAVGPDIRITSTAELGIAPQFVEAAGFAWLARQRVHGQPIELTSITGALHDSILGAWHAAPPRPSDPR
ncbi:MAG: anhydro-N-acetylmuramic acid kinase [Lautropia sp.]|nr:anhydro-N-acetylmuramic acid kinase [Lautropia sp.]